MSNEIDNFIKNFEDMFKNITPAQQTQIKNITNNSNVSNDNLIIPKDATPFLINFGVDAGNIDTLFNVSWTKINGFDYEDYVSFYKFKSTKQKMFITDLAVFNNIYDTTSTSNVEFDYAVFVNGMPLINEITTQFIAQVSTKWGLNQPRASTNAQSINTYPINFKRPLIVNKNNVLDIRAGTSSTFNVSDIYTGSLKITIGGYFSKVE